MEGRILQDILVRCKRGSEESEENLPYDVALEEDTRHGSHEYVIDLADLRQLQSRRGSRKEEADDDEDGVVQNAHLDVLGN